MIHVYKLIHSENDTNVSLHLDIGMDNRTRGNRLV